MTALSTELQMLLFSVILGVVQLFIATFASTAQRGVKWNMSSRETSTPELRGMAGRLDRAFKNFKETFVFFVAAVLLVQLTDRNTDLSAWGAQIYFGARLVYAPIYAFGINGIRSFIWIVSIVGVGMMLASVL